MWVWSGSLYIPWFQGIINNFSLSLECTKAFLCLFFFKFLLIWRKYVQRCMERFLSEEMQKRPPTELVTVRRWKRGAAAEGRWGCLTKCGITKLVMVRRVYDGPSCKFVMKFIEVIQVPRFQELKCFGTKTLDGLLCLWWSVILAVEGNEERSRRNCTSMGRWSPWQSVWPRRSVTRSVDPAVFWQISSK